MDRLLSGRQFLASRRYAVLQMNFRGSAGYGAKFTRLGYEKLGQEMRDDLTDGVRWLVDQGIPDPDRIAIYGASYGGYASLMGAAKTPGLFQCAASYAGVTDLEALMDELDWYDADTRAAFAFGRDAEKREKYSPVNLVDSVEIPILLGHGEDDSRVHVSQAESLAGALRSEGKAVELVIFEDEIHGARGERNRIEWWTRLAAFLDGRLSKPEA